MTESISRTLGFWVRKQRQSRAWSQEMLAQSSGLSLRTVQRIEKNENCAPDSLLALAAVFDAAPAILLAMAPVETTRHYFGFSARKALLVGAALSSFSVFFVIVNTMYYQFHWEILRWVDTSPIWERISASELAPILILGGPVSAIVILTPHVISLRWRNETIGLSRSILINGLLVRTSLAHWAMLLFVILLLGSILLYVALENIGHLAGVIS